MGSGIARAEATLGTAPELSPRNRLLVELGPQTVAQELPGTTPSPHAAGVVMSPGSCRGEGTATC